VAAATGAPVSIHGGDLDLYRALVRQARAFDLVAEEPPQPAQILAAAKRCVSVSSRLACCTRRGTRLAR